MSIKKENLQASIGELACEPVEQTGPTSDFLYVDISSIDRETKKITAAKNLTLSQAPSRARQVLKSGDVLVSMTRPNLNAVALVPKSLEGAIGSTGFHVLRSKWLKPEFLFALVQTDDFIEAMCDLVQGALYPAVRPKDISAHQFTFESLAQQARIVEKLEELLSDLDAGVAQLKAAQRKLGQYRQSLLKAAVEGALTASWRAQHTPTETGAQLLERILKERRARWEAKQLAKFEEQGKAPPKDWRKKYPEPVRPDISKIAALPEQWCWATTELVGDVLLGRQRAPQYLTGRWARPYLRVANIKDDWIDFSDVEIMDFDEVHFEKYRLSDGDILVSEGQSPELVGQSAIFRGHAEQLCFQKTLHRFRACPEIVLPEYAQLVFRSHVKNGVFRAIASITTNIAHLTLEKFEATRFPLPPLSEQIQIVAIAESELARLGALEKDIRIGLRQSAAQRKNILKAAFSGQLVPQDPGDEPAAVLLERIRAERAATAPAARRGRQTKVTA